MLIKELTARKTEINAEIESLETQFQKLQEELNMKREMVQHLDRLLELESGTMIPGGNMTSPNLQSEPHLVPIFAYYGGEKHEAVLDLDRIVGGRGTCVKFRNQWRSTYSAGTNIPTKNLVNGWRFWKYERSDGSIGMIDEIRWG